MNFSHYSDATVTLAVDLVNDYGAEPRAAEGRADAPFPPLPDFLAAHGLSTGDVRDEDLQPVRSLADRLFTVFSADDDAVAVAVLNELLAEAGARPQISGHDDRDWHLHYAPDGAGLPRRLAATTAMGLATVVCDYGTARLGACHGRDCRDVYVDTSRNCSRRYCSDTCSNRTNVAAHRARTRRERGAPTSVQP